VTDLDAVEDEDWVVHVGGEDLEQVELKCVCVCVCVFIYIYICVCVCVCVCVYPSHASCAFQDPFTVK
jgi:hypothetical protein